MGRSFYFSFKNIVFPPEVPIVSHILDQCTNGDLISITIDDTYEPSTFPRAPSTYGYLPVSLVNDTYTVMNNNFESISEYGATVRALYVRPIPDKEEFISTWIITTDGYVRDIEGYTIIAKLDNAVITKKDIY
jgi:hypothetical protein